MKKRKSRIGSARQFECFGKPGDVDLMPFLYNLFGKSPARRPESDHPIHHVQGGEPLPMLPLEKEKPSLFPLEVKNWWATESEAMRFWIKLLVILAAIGLIALPFLNYLMNQIHSTMGK